MNRRYKVISLLLLAALTVTIVYGTFVFQSSETYPASVNVLDYTFKLNNELATPANEIQFGAVTKGDSIISPIYEIVWDSSPPPPGPVWL
ncbi:unnamed protein product, partial [marine sediment metagenome]